MGQLPTWQPKMFVAVVPVERTCETGYGRRSQPVGPVGSVIDAASPRPTMAIAPAVPMKMSESGGLYTVTLLGVMGT